jgi:hypothetical protein
LEVDFLRMPLAGVGASKFGLFNGLLAMEASLDDSRPD